MPVETILTHTSVPAFGQWLERGLAMMVVDIRGIADDALVGPEQGASRIFLWCITALAGYRIGLHLHYGEEMFRVLSGRLRFRVGDETRDVGAGAIIVIPPRTPHAYVALEDSELEVYGQIGSGEFALVVQPDGVVHEIEVFVRDIPWSRKPPDASQYISREERLRQHHAWFETNPFEL
jgi:quercetin dioxygenase-like cupin family protein